MLASVPASMLNQIPADSGIPTGGPWICLTDGDGNASSVDIRASSPRGRAKSEKQDIEQDARALHTIARPSFPLDCFER